LFDFLVLLFAGADQGGSGPDPAGFRSCPVGKRASARGRQQRDERSKEKQGKVTKIRRSKRTLQKHRKARKDETNKEEQGKVREIARDRRENKRNKNKGKKQHKTRKQNKSGNIKIIENKQKQ